MGFGINETHNIVCCCSSIGLFIIIGCYGMNIGDIRSIIKYRNGNAMMYLKEEFEIAVLKEVLQQTGGSSKKSAEVLGLSVDCVQHKIKTYGLREFRDALIMAPKEEMREKIIDALKKRGTIAAAARYLHWELYVMQYRMRALGIKNS